MDRGLRDEIHDLVIGNDSRPDPRKRGARAILTDEVRSHLEGVYGLDRTGRLASPNRLPVVQQDPEAKETYERIARHLTDERAAGLASADAAEKLSRCLKIHG